MSRATTRGRSASCALTPSGSTITTRTPRPAVASRSVRLVHGSLRAWRGCWSDRLDHCLLGCCHVCYGRVNCASLRESRIVIDHDGRPPRPGPSGRRNGPGGARTSTDAISSTLAERVLSGELAANERLPSERQLALEFGVSRPIVREALRALVERRLIDVEPSRGAFVRGDTGLSAGSRPLDLEYLRRGTTARQLSEARLMLETEAVALAMPTPTPRTWRRSGRRSSAWRPVQRRWSGSAMTSHSTRRWSQPPTTR